MLGKVQFAGRPLRELLIEAIRYGDLPEVRARLSTAVEHALDRSQLQDLLEDRALAHDAMDASRVHRIREDMERAEAHVLFQQAVTDPARTATDPFRQGGWSASSRSPGATPARFDRSRRRSSTANTA